MSALVSYKEFIDTIDMYKNRVEDLLEQNRQLKKLLNIDSSKRNELHEHMSDLEYKLGQYQEAAHKLCQAIHYEQDDENYLAHSTRDSISSFMSLWNKEDKKLFNENLQTT